MEKFKSFLYKHKYIIVIFLLSSFFFILAGYNKNIFHVDESLSYSLANYDMGWMNYPFNGTCTRYVMDGYRAQNTAFRYDMVWHWQALDEHPPLYYALLHTVSSFFPHSLSKWFGFSINYVSFILIQLFIYKLLLKLTNDNEKVSAFAVALYALNPTVISYALLIRMYMMLGVTYVMFVYFAYMYIKSFKSNYLVGLFTVTVVGGLSNYFYYVFLVIVCSLILIYFLLKKLPWQKLLMAIGSIVAAVISNLLIFPYTLELFFQENNSAIIAGNNFKNNIINLARVKLMLDQAPFHFWGTIIIVIGCALILFARFKKDNDLNHRYSLILLVSYVGYFCLISTLSFQSSYRFVCGIDGLLYIVIGYVIYTVFKLLKFGGQKQLISCGVLFVLCLPIMGINKIQVLAYEPLAIAKENTGGNLIVFSKPGTTRYEIDVIFLERDLYGYVYNSDGQPVDMSVDDLYWMDESIIYADASFSPDYIKQWLAQNSSLTQLIDLGTASSQYHIYKAIR